MSGLHKAFEKQFLENLRAEKLLLRVIKEQLFDLGMDLNPSQTRSLQKQLRKANPEISIQINDDQVARAKITNEPELQAAIATALVDVPAHAMQAAKEIMDRLPEMMKEAEESASISIFRYLRRSYRYRIKDRHDSQRRFESNLQSVWGSAITQLEVLLGICIEAGETMAGFLTDGSASLSVEKWMVLSRLHARACQIGGEIVALLKAGYADGAMARWRSLHEVSVVASFLEDHEDDVSEQYIAHDDIEEYKNMMQQVELHPELSQDSAFVTYLDEIRTRRNELLQKYGRYFPEDYGWASKVLGKNRPTFRDIEKEVNLSHLRPYYREASFNVHAGVRGAFSRLGLHPDSEDGILLAGSSDFGLADPGHLAALSLSQVISSVFSKTAILDCIAVLNVVIQQRDLVGKEFWRAHHKIMKVYAQQPHAPDRQGKALVCL